MARRAGSGLQGLVYASGMLAFVGAASMAPRISISRTQDSTIIKYDRLRNEPATPPPADPGLSLAPEPRPTSTSNGRRKPFSDRDWIFDTGATTHVCTNKSLLHSYNRLNPYTNRMSPKAVGYFGPNPIAIVGAGDVTLYLPSQEIPNLPTTTSPLGIRSAGTRLTLHNVMHIPEAGVNLISWSQLKRSKGLNPRLVEQNDGSLVIQHQDRQLMRFTLRDGLYFLEQDPEILNVDPAANELPR